MNERDLDAEFARIVAGWDDTAADPTAPTAHASDPTASPAGHEGGDGTRAADAAAEVVPDPATEGGTDTADTTGAGSEGPGRPTGTAPAGPAPSGLLGVPIAPTTAHVWRGSPGRRDDAEAVIARAPSTDDDWSGADDDHFVPPSNPDLPTAEDDPMFWAIVVGLGGGPLLLLYLLFFDREGSSWWVVTAVGMTVVGFVLMVLRGGTERDPTDDGTRV
ncbi:MAG: hypothetical protein ABIS35_00960 [Terracoccus sp.]